MILLSAIKLQINDLQQHLRISVIDEILNKGILVVVSAVVLKMLMVLAS